MRLMDIRIETLVNAFLTAQGHEGNATVFVAGNRAVTSTGDVEIKGEFFSVTPLGEVIYTKGAMKKTICKLNKDFL